MATELEARLAGQVLVLSKALLAAAEALEIGEGVTLWHFAHDPEDYKLIREAVDMAYEVREKKRDGTNPEP